MRWARNCAEAAMIDPATLHRRARRVLPEKIGTDAVIVEAMDDATLTMLLAPLAHRRRGCLLFRLSSQTIAALVARAAGYLQDARQAREGLGRWTRPLTYTAWRRPTRPSRITAGKRPSRFSHECIPTPHP